MKIKVMEAKTENSFSHLYIDGNHCLCGYDYEIKREVRRLLKSSIRPIQLIIEAND